MIQSLVPGLKRVCWETGASSAQRFHGDGVRYKAKLIGVDVVHEAQGDKMCWDTMMKLKGLEEAARRRGQHKLRVWLKVSLSGLKMVDERTGVLLYDHNRKQISSLRRDESDPRALAYVYQHNHTYTLFYIKTANLADPVLVDIEDVCQLMDQETPQETAETPAQVPALEEVLSPPPDSSGQSDQSFQTSSSKELIEVFSVQMEAPMTPTQSTFPPQTQMSTQSSCPPQPEPMLSTSQILSMFPTQPVGGVPYSQYSTGFMARGQQGPHGHQWAGPAVVPWPTMPGGVAPWTPAPGVLQAAVPPVGAQGVLQPPAPPAGAPGVLQPAAFSFDLLT